MSAEFSYLVNISEKLKSPDAKEAYFCLLTGFYSSFPEYVVPANQGWFSVVRLKPDGKRAFVNLAGTAQNWLRCYFTGDARNAGLVDEGRLLELFPEAEFVQQAEWAVNIRNLDEAQLILGFIRDMFRT